MKEKSGVLAAVIFGLVILCFSCSARTEAQRNIEETFNQNQTNNNKVSLPDKLQDTLQSDAAKEIDTSKWKTYKDVKNGYSFRYPSNLTLQKKGDKIRLYHFIKYHYQEPCGFEEDSPFLDKLIDFDVTFKIANKDFSTADWGEYGLLSPSERPKLAGTIEGKHYMKASHFCGYYEYIYPFKKSKSLIVEDQIIGYLYKLAYSEAEKTDAWKNPNVIKPEDSALILGEIIESFEISQKERF